MLFLKSLPANRLAYNKFLWPDQVGAIVEAPDWNPEPVCGGGLHGLINGEGELDLLCHRNNAVWYAFESVDENGNPSDTETVDIDGEKGKCQRAIIRAVGTRAEATTWLVQQGCRHVPYASIIDENSSGVCLGESSTAITGDNSTNVLGDYSKAITEDESKVATGRQSIVIAGIDATLFLDDYSTAITRGGAEIKSGVNNKIITGCETTITATENADIIGEQSDTISTGKDSRVITGHYGNVTTGSQSVSISGPSSTAISGINSTVVTGGYGKATAGNNSIVIAGCWGTVSGGHNSVLVLRHNYADPLDGTRCYEPRVAIVGKNGIKPNTPYRLDGKGDFIEATP